MTLNLKLSRFIFIFEFKNIRIDGGDFGLKIKHAIIPFSLVNLALGHLFILTT